MLLATVLFYLSWHASLLLLQGLVVEVSVEKHDSTGQRVNRVLHPHEVWILAPSANNKRPLLQIWILYTRKRIYMQRCELSSISVEAKKCTNKYLPVLSVKNKHQFGWHFFLIGLLFKQRLTSRMKVGTESHGFSDPKLHGRWGSQKRNNLNRYKKIMHAQQQATARMYR